MTTAPPSASSLTISCSRRLHAHGRVGRWRPADGLAGAALGSGAAVGLVAGVGADLDPAALDPLRAAGINLGCASRRSRRRAWQVVGSTGGARSCGVPWKTLRARGGAVRVWHVPGSPLSLGHPPRRCRAGPRLARELRAKAARQPEPFRPPPARCRTRTCATCWTRATSSPRTGTGVRLLGLTTGWPSCAACATWAGASCLRLGARRGGWTSRAVRAWRPAVPASVVDEVGAGNAFAGALLARLDDGSRRRPAASAAARICGAGRYRRRSPRTTRAGWRRPAPGRPLRLDGM